MTKLQRPISISQVANTLGSTSTDLGTLCKASSINKWAKCKPVFIRSSYEGGAALLNNQTVYITKLGASGVTRVPVWVGQIPETPKTGYTLRHVCGVKVPLVGGSDANKVISIIDGYPSDNESWQLSGVQEWFRLAAFEGYDSEAQCPFVASCNNVVYTDEQPYFSLKWQDVDDDSASLTLRDFMNYFGTGFKPYIIFVKGTTKTYAEVDASIDTDDAFAGNVAPEGISTGTWKAYLAVKKGEFIIPLPSTSTCPNPLTFNKRSDYNPSSWIFSKLSYNIYNEGWFGYTKNNGFQRQSEVGENSYISLCTNNPYCISFDVTNTSSSSVVMIPGKFSIRFIDNNLDVWESGFNVSYKSGNGAITAMTSNYTIASGATITLYLEAPTLFQSGEPQECISGTTVNSIYDGTAEILYDNRSIEDINMSIIYTNTQYNGKFYSTSRGFFE